MKVPRSSLELKGIPRNSHSESYGRSSFRVEDNHIGVTSYLRYSQAKSYGRVIRRPSGAAPEGCPCCWTQLNPGPPGLSLPDPRTPSLQRRIVPRLSDPPVPSRSGCRPPGKSSQTAPKGAPKGSQRLPKGSQRLPRIVGE